MKYENIPSNPPTLQPSNPPTLQPSNPPTKLRLATRILSVFLIGFLLFSCQDDFPVGPLPPNTTSVNQTIEITADYLGDCSSSASFRDVRGLVVWEVSVMNNSGNLVVFSASDTNGTGDDIIFNDDSPGSNSLTHIIQAPNQGEWFLRLEVQLECDACCNNQFIPALGRFGCPNFSSRFGESIYMSAGAMMAQVVSPSPIVITIENITCIGCRGTC